MTPEPGDDFVSSFLDDYFAECEEHLERIRRALLALETEPEAARAASHLEELFRSFHSLKGLSAMVDVREAERLAHELESWLRALRAGELPVTAEAVGVLIDATAGLEGVIAARRAGRPAPPIDGMVKRLQAPPAAGAASPSRPEADAGGSPQWRFRFVPSAALAARGVKVDVVRARLAAIGRILAATPTVPPAGGIAFEFLVAGPADEAVFAPWREEGLSWERVRGQGEALAENATPGPSDPAPFEPSLLAPSHFVRVDLTRLDEVMSRVADLVLSRTRLEQALHRTERLLPPAEWRTLQEIALALERQLRDLRQDVMRVRLVRVDEILRRMPFVVRDLAREAGKDVKVELAGQETELDKFLVERMMDPVLHLVRNAVSHGIESPAERQVAGKMPHGFVRVSASTSGEMVVLEVADDGRGVAPGAVAERARAAGLPAADGPLDPQRLLELICEPGLSTRPDADRTSGRGIGMAVVRSAVQELGGTLTLETTPGRGTRFVIALPLTLAITGALIASVEGQTFAVPQSSVQEVIEVDAHAVRRLGPAEIVPYRDGGVPLLRLGRLLGLAETPAVTLQAFIVGTGRDTVAVAVDRILALREIVVRTVVDPLLKIEGVIGATELGDRRAVLILDLVALARAGRGAPAGAPPLPAAAPARSAARLEGSVR